MFGKNARRLIAIFRSVLPSDERDPMEYLKSHASQIEITGKLFEYLNLAKPDQRSHLGWRPTPLLLEIMNNADDGPYPMWSDKPIYIEDELIIELLCQAAFGDVRHTYPAGSFSLAFGVLHELGLMRVSTKGDIAPNRRLRRLFADAYYGRNSLSTVRGALRELASSARSIPEDYWDYEITART